MSPDCNTDRYYTMDRGLTIGAQTVYSYLTGLAKVGDLIEVPRTQIMQDCGYKNFHSYYKHLNVLIEFGLVQRIACGSRQSSGLLVVNRHFEEWKRGARG